MTIGKWTIGSDAEMFVKSLANKSVFPVCGIVGGTKARPKPMGTGGYFVQEDNILLEVNIPVCNSASTFIKAMLEGVRRAKNQLPPSLYADACPSGNVDKAFLSIEAACVFGCEPDFNAWLREVNPRPHSEDPTLRTAAAHVHIGWENPTDADRHNLIKAADLFVAIPALYEDTDTKRRELYGKAGAFRMKPYGVEHRVLSNYWINSISYIEMVYRRYSKAIDFVNKGGELTGEDSVNIVNAINNNDKKLGDILVRKFGLE